MSRPWVKLSTDILDHFELDAVSPVAFKVYVKALALAGRVDDDGRLGTIAQVAYRLRLDEVALRAALDELDGRIVERDSELFVRDWTDHQPAKRTPEAAAQITERTRAHRARKATRNGNDEGTTRERRGNAPSRARAGAPAPSREVEVEEETEGEKELPDTRVPRGTRTPSGRDKETPNSSGAGAPRGKRNGKSPPAPREPKPLWDAFCAAWHLPPSGGRHKSLAGEFDRDCVAVGATADEFRQYVAMSLADGSWGEYVQVHNTRSRFLAWRDRRHSDAVVRF